MFEEAGAFQAVEARGQIELGAVFGDDDALGGDQVRGVEIFEDFRAAAVVVRRVQENKVGDEVTIGKFIESAFGVGGEYFDAAGNLQGFEILANQADGSWIAVDEENFASATADGFNSDGAGAGVKIDEQGLLDGRAEDVEERFSETIAGGTDLEGVWSFQAAAAIFSGDDSHESPKNS